MPETDAIAQPRNRVRVFIDFWNYTLSMREVDSAFRTDWSAIGPALADAAGQKVGGPTMAEYQGLSFYGSYDPSSRNDDRLRRWAETKVDTFRGVSVSMVPRQRKRTPPRCPACHTSIGACPQCGADMRGTEEKGVDVRIATDMIHMAWADNYDTAVLVSADKDFVPAVELLETRGIKVVHGCFPPRGAHLTRACWDSHSLDDLRPEFRMP